MQSSYEIDLFEAREKLNSALKNKRSSKWCLLLWGRFVKLRDGHRCLICDSQAGIQAHHIFRKATIGIGMFELGNGITLCKECHTQFHAEFNGKPDNSKPLNFQGGDDQDGAAFLYGLLHADAVRRSIDEDEFYYISDELCLLFVRFQGYEQLFESVALGELSRIKFAQMIWQPMPEKFYEKFAASMFGNLL